MDNIRVLPHVCKNPKCRELILPPFPRECLCKKCRDKGIKQ